VPRRTLQVNIGAVEQAYDQVEHTRDLLQQEQVLRMVRSSVSPNPTLSFSSVSSHALSGSGHDAVECYDTRGFAYAMRTPSFLAPDFTA
jgi:hypothetical protein